MLSVIVMPGLLPGIPIFSCRGTKDVDGRDKPDHDGEDPIYSVARFAAFANFFSTRSRFSLER